MATFFDDFNRANSTTSAGASWTNRLNVVGINSNAAYPVTADVTCWATYNTVMGTDDVQVDVVLGAHTLGGADVYILLGNSTGGEGAVASFVGSSTLTIATKSNWSGTTTSRDTATTPALSQGDTLSFVRVGNVYTTMVNGTPVSGSSWTDSGDLLPRDSSHRLTGLGAGQGFAYWRMDSFTAADQFALALPSKPLFVKRAPLVRASHY